MEKNKLIAGIIIVLVFIVGGVAAFHLMQSEKPTLEEANVIIDESIKKTFDLTSFRAKGNASFQVKSGETVLVKATMRDTQFSATNVWDFAKQNSEMVVSYDVMINLPAITNLIKVNTPSEELDLDIFMGMTIRNLIVMLEAVGKANITVTMEMKSIDSDSYMKTREITGLREVITSAAGSIMAEMIMGGIDPKIGVWHKTPADLMVKEEMNIMFEKLDSLMDVVVKSSSDILFVKEVLPNTTVNDIAVYNFVYGIDLDKTRDFIIALVPIIGEMAEQNAEEIAEAKQDIEENWPKIETVIRAIEIDTNTYICQKTKFTIKDTGTFNMNFYSILTAIRPMIAEEMTVEELAEFNKLKESIKDISFVITGNFVYSDHNAVPAIMPPAEYEIIRIEDDEEVLNLPF